MSDSDQFLKDMLAKKRGEERPSPPRTSSRQRFNPTTLLLPVVITLCIVPLLLFARYLFTSPQSNAPATLSSILANGQLIKLPDGGLETAPFNVGKETVTIPVWNQYCIHIGRNGVKVKLTGTDGPMNNSFEARYVSNDGTDVSITVIYYPFAHEKCAHLR